MKVHLELYASLMEYLPERSRRHRATLEVSEDTSPHQLLNAQGVPREQAHLVVVNGVYVPLEDRDRPLSEGDVLAVWPPVAGG